MPREFAMRFDIITIFPDFFSGPLNWGVMRRAGAARIIQTEIHDLRKWTHDRHNTVDDRPFGGGEGMVLKPEPMFEAVEAVLGQPETAQGAATAVVLLSASGKVFRQPTAARLSQLRRIVLLCGRYEGVDERVAEHLADHELSVGDFVLSGGELGAAIIMDAVTRLLPGALGNEDSTRNESFGSITPELQESGSEKTPIAPPDLLRSVTPEVPQVTGGILDFPHFTRPQVFRGWEVPSVLIGGDHKQVRRWRRKAALAKTLKNRPELLVNAPLTSEDGALLCEVIAEIAST
jgi:tRNA (guanine37-N1)-methyltransferase